MNDIELLEMAAKASGLPWDQWVVDGNDSWNPLEDDGDALRLAVTLHIPIETDDRGCLIEVVGRVYEAANGDLFAATRRAIVRAAAEIGKAMP